MKTLITKTGRLIDLAQHDTRTIEEIMSDIPKIGISFSSPQYEPIEEYIEINVSDETFKFIESVANIEFEFYEDRTYIINNLKFKLKQDENS